MANFNWVCPFCGTATTITDSNYTHASVQIGTKQSKFDRCGFAYRAIACPNATCKELYLEVGLHRSGISDGQYRLGEAFQGEFWKLRPESIAKPQPDYIPEEIRKTYREACRIVSLSPKASATLSRRCLQGMIRDFWDVSDRPNLYQEIEAIHDRVDPDTWDAIDAVRTVGNIGAHMEKDVNLIVDVEDNEAELLVGLIETLFADWYVSREKRRERNQAIKKMAKNKKPSAAGAKSEVWDAPAEDVVAEEDSKGE